MPLNSGHIMDIDIYLRHFFTSEYVL
jgi:hypothetical protein